MEHVNLIGERLVKLEEHKEIALQYYVVQEPAFEADSTGENVYKYGIRIDKQYGGIVESEEVRALTYSQSDVNEFVKILMLHTVTPISLVEIVDDLITLKDFS